MLPLAEQIAARKVAPVRKRAARFQGRKFLYFPRQNDS